MNKKKDSSSGKFWDKSESGSVSDSDGAKMEGDPRGRKEDWKIMKSKGYNKDRTNNLKFAIVSSIHRYYLYSK